MKFSAGDLINAVAVLDLCRKSNALQSSKTVRLLRKANRDRLVLHTAADVQAVAWVRVEGSDAASACVDRALFSQWVKGLDKSAEVALRNSGDALHLRSGRRAGRFPVLADPGGLEIWPKSPRAARLALEESDLATLRLAMNYAGGEGIDPSLSCLWFSGASVHACNQLTMLEAAVSAKWRGPVPLELVRALAPGTKLLRSPVAALVRLENGAVYRTFDRDTLLKFPEKQITRGFQAALNFKRGVTLYPVGSVLAVLRKLSALVNKSDALDASVQIDTTADDGKARFSVSTPSGAFREVLDCTSPADRVSVLIPPLMAYLSYCPVDAAVQVLYESGSSPYLVTCADASPRLLISRKVL